MATPQTSRIASRQLERLIRPPGESLQFACMLLVLSFSVLTNWIPERWPGAAAQTGVFALASLAAARAALGGAAWPASPPQIPLAAAVLWGLAQLAAHRTVYRFETWSAVVLWLSLLFAFSAAYQIFTNPSLRRAFHLFAIYFGGAVAIWAILQLFSGDGKMLWIFTPPTPNPMGPYLNYDHYSAFMELIFPIALWGAVRDRKRAVLCGCVAALMYASVIAGTSRTGSVLVNVELGAVLIPALTRQAGRRSRGHSPMPFRIGLLVLIFTAVVGWDALLQRFAAKDPFAGRREMWRAGILMIRDHPWLGFGLGAWTAAYPRYAVFDPGAFVNAAHSDWLQWAGEGGIPFALLLCLVAARAAQLGWKAPWGLGVLFVFLHSLVDFPLQKPSILLWTVALLAALEAGRSNHAFGSIEDP